MAHESDIYDFTVDEHAEGSAKTQKILGRIGVLSVPIIYVIITLAANLPMLSILAVIYIPVILFFWKWFNREFRYRLESGNMTFAIIRGGNAKKAKNVLTVTIKDMEIIAPYDEDAKAKLSAEGIKSTHSFASSLAKGKDIYYAVYEKDGAKQAVFFEATQRALQVLYYYNHNTLITKVER